MYEIDADVVPVFKSSISWTTSLQDVEACCFFQAPPWCDAWAAVQHMDGSSVSICRTPAQARAYFEVNTSKTTWQKGRKPRSLKEKERQKMIDVVKGCWMVLHTDAQMNNEEGRVVLLSMRDVFWGEYFLIGKRNDVTEKRRESSWKFCFICQIFQKEKIIHLLFYLLPTFKIIVFCFSSAWSPNWNVGKFNKTFSEWQSITHQISNTKCIPDFKGLMTKALTGCVALI
jgi:hypothetical protein